ncbi:hypothetical protein GGR56DRAFT_530815 [Xylariaceae sp. FL0804]|nr:hypothetical protein GGR56DRAFT_530815 [Xylariaceae sp. FL0804]
MNPQPQVPVVVPSPDQTRSAVQAVAEALGSTAYAIVGGAACTMLGSHRSTWDVDFVVPKGQTRTARSLLKQTGTAVFNVDPRTQRTTFTPTPAIEIEILTPPLLFQQDFTAATPTVLVDGARVLKPALILNAKCRSVVQRTTPGKRESDAADILFLLRWCAANEQYPSNAEVPNAILDVVVAITEMFGGRENWENAGYDFQAGCWKE